MIRQIEHRGQLLQEVDLPNERRADGVAPAHGNGIQLSKDRFLILVSTLAFRGVDDTRSICWELRADGYDGKVIKTGRFAESIDDWYPIDDKTQCVRQYGHPVAFGVPKGALINGERVAHENVFVLKWRKVARVFNAEGGFLLWNSEPLEVRQKTQCVEWMQFRLNDAEDDLEIIGPVQRLRQKGYEDGDVICEQGFSVINQTYIQAVPYNDDCSQWVDANTFNIPDETELRSGDTGGTSIATMRYAFNADAGLYEWVQTGQPIRDNLFEPSVARYGDSWIILGRRADRRPPAWMRTDDLFGAVPQIHYPDDVQAIGTPMTAYTCPDGALRLLTGDMKASPQGLGRNPLYMWQIDPDNGFRSSDRRVIMDTFEAGVPITMESHPIVDMPKLLPHAGGASQTLIHRIRTAAFLVPEYDYGASKLMSDEEFHATSIYYAKVNYEETYPGVWGFA